MFLSQILMVSDSCRHIGEICKKQRFDIVGFSSVIENLLNRNTPFARPFLKSGSHFENSTQRPPPQPEAPLGDEFDDDTDLFFGVHIVTSLVRQ